MKRRQGFTIVEVIVVIVIIASLALLTVFAFGAWRKRTAKTEMRQEIMTVVSSLKSYQAFQNKFPGTPGGSAVSPRTISGLTYKPSANVGVTYALRLDGESYCLRAQNYAVPEAPNLYLDSKAGESITETPCS